MMEDAWVRAAHCLTLIRPDQARANTHTPTPNPLPGLTKLSPGGAHSEEGYWAYGQIDACMTGV